MNRGAAGLFSCAPGRRERGRRPDLPADRDPARGRHRRRLPARGEPGAVLQRVGRVPPDQSRDRGQRTQPVGGRRRALQETRCRDVRRDRRPRSAAQAAPERIRRSVRGPVARGGRSARHLSGRGPHHAGREGRTTVSAVATLQNVTMRFRGHTALDDVTTAFEEHAITGLLGRNGAGKTTLLQLLTGHRVATAGDVRAFGAAPYENADVVGRICFVRESQLSAYYLTCRVRYDLTCRSPTVRIM